MLSAFNRQPTRAVPENLWFDVGYTVTPKRSGSAIARPVTNA